MRIMMHLSSIFRQQSDFCASNYAPITACLQRKFAQAFENAESRDDDTGDKELLRLIHEPWLTWTSKQLHDHAIPSRLANALHALVISGKAPELADLFKQCKENENDMNAPCFQRLLPTAMHTLREHFEECERFMQHEPQTNECNRSTMLLLGFLRAAEVTGVRDLSCFEIGASAGLNACWNRYCFGLSNDKQSQAFGDLDSNVRLGSFAGTEWRGKPVHDKFALKPLTVSSYRGCDRRPINVHDDKQTLVLRACVWPGKVGDQRLQRLEAAVEIIKRANVHVEEQDAVEFVEQHVKLSAGKLTVLYHSFVFQYLSEESQQRIVQHMQKLASLSSPTQPLAWVSLEFNHERAAFETRVQIWPKNRSDVICISQPHGQWIDVLDFEK